VNINANKEDMKKSREGNKNSKLYKYISLISLKEIEVVGTIIPDLNSH
jgi:hypothetical protein